MKSQKLYLQEAKKLHNKPYISESTYREFVAFIRSTTRLTKETNPANHLCSFFLPIHIPSGQVYLGHHIKANDWIPPGGHIKIHETPEQAARREFQEELGIKLTIQPVRLFDLSIKDVSDNPKHPCKMHYDFWFAVETERIEFKFLKKEFYDAGWVTLKKAKTLTRLLLYNRIIQIAGQLFF